MRTGKTLELRKDFQRPRDSLFRILSAREIRAVKLAANAVLFFSSGMAGNGGLTRELLVADLDREVDGSSSAKAALSWGSADIEDENPFQEAFPHCAEAA